jgi:2-oxoglutarate dehydrogenase E2 component (dihydrolipoamide succinyltransferase)
MALIDLKVPSIGESVTEVTLAKILKKTGEIVRLDDPICEFESDKATFELPAEASGSIEWMASEGQDLKVGDVVAKINTDVASPSISTTKDEVKIENNDSSNKPHPAKNHPSPSAAKEMREQNIDPSSIQGTGKDGRISLSDVKNKPTTTENIPTAAPIKKSIPQTNMSHERTERIEKMSRMRRTIAKRLVSAKNDTAMLTTFNEVDMSQLMELRTKYNEAYLAKYGIKIGFMSLFAKACATVLLQMPEINAFIDGEDLIMHDYVDISLAISTPTGLVVPPIRDVDKLSIHEFEFKLKELAEKARNGKLSIEEMSGGTFTITNGGVFGSLMSTPILNEPQSAILGMHAIKDRPVAINGQVVIRPMMYLALSYDHRVIDGSSSVTFLVKVKELLEDPMKLFLGL